MLHKISKLRRKLEASKLTRRKEKRKWRELKAESKGMKEPEEKTDTSKWVWFDDDPESNYTINTTPVNVESERTWEDHTKIKSLRKGAFSELEVNLLKDSLCTYAKTNDLSINDLARLCSASIDPDLKGAWTQIATALPDRSVQACHNVCRRKFNTKNYQGQWSLLDEQSLIESVDHMGHEWKTIGEGLGRTAENVRDKWRELGGKNHAKRKKGDWSLEEKLELIRLVNDTSETKFLKWETEVDYGKFKVEEESKEAIEAMSEKQKRTYERGFKKSSEKIMIYKDVSLEIIVPLIIDNPEDLPKRDFAWNLISGTLKTRSYDDCWNMWNQ